MTQRNISESELRERVRIELREVAELLESAKEIAEGLVGVCEHAYKHDGRTKEALAAANRACSVLMDEHQAAERRADDAI